VIDIIDVSSPVDLGRSLVDSGPLAVDDIFVQDPFLPGNANGSGEARRTLVQTNGTGPLSETEEGESQGFAKRDGPGSGSFFLRAYLIKGSGDHDLLGVVWPFEGGK